MWLPTGTKFDDIYPIPAAQYDPNNAPGANISRGQAMMLPDDIKMYTKTEANRLRGVNWRSFDSATIPVKDKFILKKDIIEWFQKNYL